MHNDRQHIGLSIEDQFAEWQVNRAAEENGSGEEEETEGGLFVSTARGVGRAFNQVYGLVDTFGKTTAKMSGLYKLFRDDEEERAWLEEMEETMGEGPLDIASRPGGFWGFYEGAVQFATGFFPAVKGAQAVGITNTLLRGATAGAAADFAVWDPHEERLADLVQLGPEWLQNPVSDYLSAEEDDGEFEGRFKSALEGLMLGTTIDALWTGVKLLRIRRAHRAGRLNNEEAVERFSEALGNLETRPEDGPFGVNDSPDGEADLIIRQARELAERGSDRRAREVAFEGPDRRSGAERRAGFDPLGENPVEAARRLIGESSDAEQAVEIRFPNRVEAERAAAALNMVHRLNAQPKAGVTLDGAQHSAVLRVAQRIREGNDPADIQALAEGIDFNFQRIDTPEEAKSMLNALSEVLRPAFQERTNRTAEGLGQSHAETVRLAENIVGGVSGAEMVEHLRNMRGVTEVLPQTVTAARLMLAGQAQRVYRLSRAVDLDPTNVIAVRQLADEMDGLGNLSLEVAGTGSDLGRALNAMAIDVSDEALEAARKGSDVPKGTVSPARKPRFAHALRKNKYTARELSALARSLQLTRGDPESVMRALKLTARASAEPHQRGLWDKIVSFRVSMMLSGVRTQVVNAVSSSLAAGQVPAEVMLGGALTGNRAMARQGWDMLRAPVMDSGFILRRAAEGAAEAWRAGESILDPRYIKDEHGIQRTFNNPQANFFVRVLGWPGRALTTVDEFVKRMAYLSHVRSQSLRNLRQEALENGYEWTPEDIGHRVYDDLIHAVDEDGGARTWYNSLQHAREVTFTNKLHEGTVGHWLQGLANNNPIARFVVPFVRTPVNIFQFAHQRTPGLNLFSREMREMWQAGGEQRATFLGRSASGLLAYSLGGWLAYHGQMSGNGPSNPQLRAQMLEAGWQPYSVRLGDRWYSYRRLEPIATPLAIMADFFDFAGELDATTLEEASTALVAAMTSSVSSKSFLLGITEFFDMMGNQNEHATRSFLSSGVRSFLPALLRQANTDPIWRETESYLDDIKASLPGFSTMLEPRRNLFGEPVVRPARQAFGGGFGGYLNSSFNPFTVVDASGMDDIQTELANLGKAMSMPMTTRGRNSQINLRDRNRWVNSDPERAGQSPYDRMMELVSEGGLREQMTRLVRSDQWNELTGNSEAFVGGGRWVLANKLVRAHVNRAEGSMLQEYPDLRRALIDDRRERVEAMFQPSS